MSEKYHVSRLITNDLYLAAYLLCCGAELCAIVHNERRRVSFVFIGENLHQLRTDYEAGIVRLNVRSFRNHLITVRRKMDAEHRSKSLCPEYRSRS